MSEAKPSSIDRRTVLAAPLALTLAAPLAAGAQNPKSPVGKKVLRLPFRGAETSFDPSKIFDVYSTAITSQIFEALYGYDHLARPILVIPVLAEGMPVITDDFRVWTVKIRSGIYFADDPAFKGQRRELTASDVIYGYKRSVDPANKSPRAADVLENGILGLEQLRKAALDKREAFNYDTPLEGMKALDRYTVQFRLADPRPRFITGLLTAASTSGAQAREVVEFYGDQIGAHPVGTGPFRLKQWVRSAKVVLERNPGFREMVYDAHPAPGDAEGQAILARFKGRKLPMIDEVEVSIIQESQPMWLAFLNAEVDAMVTTVGSVPSEYTVIAAPNGKLAPNLAKRGVQLVRSVLAQTTLWYFNMEDPVVGGYTPEKVALRRAISLAYDVEREIRLIRRGQAVPAQSMMVPFTSGYDPRFKSAMSEYDPARAMALLDMYGYVDRNGDGFREMPDGSPLVLQYASQPEQIYRAYNDLFRRGMQEVGLKATFPVQQWPEHLKRAQAGKLQMWSLGLSSTDPDGQTSLQTYYSPQAGAQNLARFKLPEMDRVYEQTQPMPDGPEREALFLEAEKLAVAYLPYRFVVNPLGTELLYPWVHGYRRPVFWSNWWHMVDMDPERRTPA
ncbi:MAG: ABC transporter substrate-binding protein [Pseudomonadota bacterium]|nr:ABC transporter substrate-binding protein [Pseudomonadota bacterium]